MPKPKFAPPKGYQAVTPYLRVKGAAQAIDFYKAAFGARERYRLTMGDKLGHAEIDIGGVTIMLSDEFPEMGALGPKSLNGPACVFSLYVKDAEAVFAGAVAAGATEKRPVSDQFYGDRTGQVEDPFGHVWNIQQRLEDVSPKKMQKRLDELMAGGGDAQKAKPPRQAKAKFKAKR